MSLIYLKASISIKPDNCEFISLFMLFLELKSKQTYRMNELFIYFYKIICSDFMKKIIKKKYIN